MLDIDIIDAHHHFWDLSRSYPWLQGPADPDRFTGDDTPIRENYLPHDYRHDFETLKLVGSVHVDAGAGDPLIEATWLQELHDTEGLPTVVVAGADLLHNDIASHLEQLADLPTVRGIRHILNWHSDPNFTYTNRDDIITDPAWRKNFARLESLGLSFDLQVYASQLPQAAELAAAFPGTSIVLNHTGMPISSDSEGFSNWRTGIRRLASQPNVSLKISGLGMTDHDWTVESIRPYVLESIEAFTVRRSMFASNFPVDKLYSDIPTLYGAFDELTRAFSGDERRALFADTAREIYRIPTTYSRQETY
jgi:predicted TIM-barrel fold metal-dependent hydrolase